MEEPNAMPTSLRPLIRGLPDLKTHLADTSGFRAVRDRPFVVLSYAQSVDGSIAGRNRERLRLSGPASMHLTYSIRALCDTILVGIGTLLADDPRLTVKHVQGANPHPIVLDTRLRTPAAARLLQHPDARPWLVHDPATPSERVLALRRAGADPVACPTDADGRIDLAALMRWLAGRGVKSLMVEGGARVITSFIRSQLVDLIIVTISPRMVAGLPVIDPDVADRAFDLHIDESFYEPLGRDLVLWGRPRWDTA
jgi:3,4-dihydroxy 2-butanone 4-phosphate synthase/GTP cyclohydrolase II